jgi:hypothetical protein
MFKLSPSTFHEYKWRVIAAINAVLKDNVLFPTSEAGSPRSHLFTSRYPHSPMAGLRCLAQGFTDRAGSKAIIPNVVAATDCIVLEMRAPTSIPFQNKEKGKESNISSQFCRKGFFGTTVLAFVDSKMRFLSLSINCGASSHDSTVFGCSKMGHLLSLSKEEGGLDPKWVVVGDDAFKTLPHVMTPYQKQWLSNEQKNFNYCLSKLRCTVECAFGLWKGKWGIFWRPLLVKQRRIAELVEVTARLHNLCINRYSRISYTALVFHSSYCNFRHVSTDMRDFVVADDVFWQRTCSDAVRAKYERLGRPLPPAPIAIPEVNYADEATVGAFVGDVPTVGGMKSMRYKAMMDIARNGLIRPIARVHVIANRVRGHVGGSNVHVCD